MTILGNERDAGQPGKRLPRVTMADGRRGTILIERHETEKTDPIVGRLIDLSRGGVKVATDRCIPFGETVTLTAEFPDIDVEFRVFADVQWNRQEEGSGWLIGCSFKPGLPNETVDQLANEGYLERRLSPRYPIACNGHAQWELSAEQVPIRIVDFSAEGCSIVAPKVDETGQRFHVELKNSDGETIYVAVRKRWHTKDEGGYLIGAEFLDRNDSHRLWEIAYKTSACQPPHLAVRSAPSRWVVASLATLLVVMLAYSPLVGWWTRPDSSDPVSSVSAAAVYTPPQTTPTTDRNGPGDSSIPADTSAPQSTHGAAISGAGEGTPWRAQQQDWQTHRQRQQAQLDKQRRELADRAVQLTRREVALQQQQTEWARRLQRQQRDIESRQLTLLKEQSTQVAQRRARIEAPPADRPIETAAAPRMAFDLTALPEPQSTPADAANQPPPIATADRDSAAPSEPARPAEPATPIRGEGPEPEALVEVVVEGPIGAAPPATTAQTRLPTQPIDSRPPRVDPTVVSAAPVPPSQSSAPPTQVTTEADSKAALAAFHRGRGHLEAGQFADAVAAFQEVVRLQTENPLGYYLLALAHYRNGDQDTADQHIWTAAELERQYPIANWGNAMRRYQGTSRLWLERSRARAKKSL